MHWCLRCDRRNLRRAQEQVIGKGCTDASFLPPTSACTIIWRSTCQFNQTDQAPQFLAGAHAFETERSQITSRVLLAGYHGLHWHQRQRHQQVGPAPAQDICGPRGSLSQKERDCENFLFVNAGIAKIIASMNKLLLYADGRTLHDHNCDAQVKESYL